MNHKALNTTHVSQPYAYTLAPPRMTFTPPSCTRRQTFLWPCCETVRLQCFAPKIHGAGTFGPVCNPLSPRPDIGRPMSSSRQRWHVVPAKGPRLLQVTAVGTVLGGTPSLHSPPPPPFWRALLDEVGTVMSSIVHHALCLLGWGRSRRQPRRPWFSCWGGPRRRPHQLCGSSGALNNSRFTERAKYVRHSAQRLPLVAVLVVLCKKLTAPPKGSTGESRARWQHVYFVRTRDTKGCR